MTNYKIIEGFPDYRVGDDGTVWSKKSGDWKLIKPYLHCGYQKVHLYKVGKSFRRYVHILVITAFVGEQPKEGYVVCHNNSVRDDNRLANLRWDSHKNNMQDKWSAGTYQHGENATNSKLTKVLVEAIRQEYIPNKFGYEKLAKKYKVSKSTIRNIIKSRSWIYT